MKNGLVKVGASSNSDGVAFEVWVSGTFVGYAKTKSAANKIYTASRKYPADVVFDDGRVIKTEAQKIGRSWRVGGDYAIATTRLGAKIFIQIDDKIYLLKGAILKFQDYAKVLVNL